MTKYIPEILLIVGGAIAATLFQNLGWLWAIYLAGLIAGSWASDFKRIRELGGWKRFWNLGRIRRS